MPAPQWPPSSDLLRRRLDEARRLDAEIREVHRRQNGENARLCELLLEMRERQLHRSLGYETLGAYGRRVLRCSKTRTHEMAALAEQLRGLPRIREAFRDGRIAWTAARPIARVATAADEREWLEKAETLSVRALELEVARAKGEEPRVPVTLSFTEEDLASVEDAVRAVVKEKKGDADAASAVAETCRRALLGGTVGGPRVRVVIHVCAVCEKATRETSEGAVEVSETSLERAACDAEVVDLRGGAARTRVSRTMPPRIAAFIDARDKGRCRVPGCGNRGFVERHHEGGWREVGHDHTLALLLCSRHHADRHEGTLGIEVDVEADIVRFRLADGSLVGESAIGPAAPRARRAAGPHVRTGEGAEPAVAPAPEPAPGAAGPHVRTGEGVRALAIQALRRLECRAGEARSLVDRALGRERETPWTLDELVGEALRLLPGPLAVATA